MCLSLGRSDRDIVRSLSFGRGDGDRFYLHGDVAPDERMAAELPQVDLTGKPLFALRGMQPFHDFPEGPDWWNADEYKLYLGQLPKMAMNFFGLHTYPENGVGPEPIVWISPPGEMAKAPGSKPVILRGTIPLPASRRLRLFAASHGEFSFGAADLFDFDDYVRRLHEGHHSLEANATRSVSTSVKIGRLSRSPSRNPGSIFTPHTIPVAT